MLSTNQKGAIAEAKITAAAIDLGIEVYRPCVEGGRFDLIFAFEADLIRVQCKWARRRRETIAVPAETCCRTRDGYLRRRYTKEEIDALAAYSPDTGHCYLLPAAMVAGRAYRFGCLRLETDSARGYTWPPNTSSGL